MPLTCWKKNLMFTGNKNNAIQLVYLLLKIFSLLQFVSSSVGKIKSTTSLLLLSIIASLTLIPMAALLFLMHRTKQQVSAANHFQYSGQSLFLQGAQALG